MKRNPDQILCGSAAAAAFIAVVQLTSIPQAQLTWQLKVALHCFAFSVPLLVLASWVDVRPLEFRTIRDLIIFVSPIWALAAVAIGFAALFLHFGLSVGLLAIAVGVTAFWHRLQ